MINFREMSEMLYKGAKEREVTDKMIEMTSNYTCPECNGYCCKFDHIRFQKDEYCRIVESIDEETKDLIIRKSKRIKGDRAFNDVF